MRTATAITATAVSNRFCKFMDSVQTKGDRLSAEEVGGAHGRLDRRFDGRDGHGNDVQLCSGLLLAVEKRDLPVGFVHRLHLEVDELPGAVGREDALVKPFPLALQTAVGDVPDLNGVRLAGLSRPHDDLLAALDLAGPVEGARLHSGVAKEER